MTKLWGKPSGMWTQMVLNFHIFKFHTTRFSHITHVTLKPLSHTQSGISCTRSFMSSWRNPTAAPPANPQLCLGRIPSFSIPQLSVHILLHLAIISYKENKRGTVRDTVLSRIQFLLHFFAVSVYDCVRVFVLCMPQPLKYILVCKLVFLSESPLSSELSLLLLTFLSLPSLDVW